MPSIEAQRTLVKSPPELWAELSDPASLARHLGDFGEIRIARVEPEQSVEWEAQEVTGTVQLKPSGWGTKVTLTVVRETPEPEAIREAEAEPVPKSEPVPETEPVLEAEPVPKSEPVPETEPVLEAEPVAEESPEAQPATRRSRFFARLFRRGARPIELEQPPAVEAELEAEPEQPEPAQEVQPPNLAAELAAELARVEEAMAEQDAELLTAVLDRLGAAHHRPFSRG
jgi:hypothetical protein